jgi:hypothetical protein
MPPGRATICPGASSTRAILGDPMRISTIAAALVTISAYGAVVIMRPRRSPAKASAKAVSGARR